MLGVGVVSLDGRDVLDNAVTDASAGLLLDVLLLSGLDGHHRVGLDGNIVDAGASLLVRVLSLFLLFAPSYSWLRVRVTLDE